MLPVGCTLLVGGAVPAVPGGVIVMLGAPGGTPTGDLICGATATMGTRLQRLDAGALPINLFQLPPSLTACSAGWHLRLSVTPLVGAVQTYVEPLNITTVDVLGSVLTLPVPVALPEQTIPIITPLPLGNPQIAFPDLNTLGGMARPLRSVAALNGLVREVRLPSLYWLQSSPDYRRNAVSMPLRMRITDGAVTHELRITVFIPPPRTVGRVDRRTGMAPRAVVGDWGDPLPDMPTMPSDGVESDPTLTDYLGAERGKWTPGLGGEVRIHDAARLAEPAVRDALASLTTLRLADVLPALTTSPLDAALGAQLASLRQSGALVAPETVDYHDNGVLLPLTESDDTLGKVLIVWRDDLPGTPIPLGDALDPLLAAAQTLLDALHLDALQLPTLPLPVPGQLFSVPATPLQMLEVQVLKTLGGPPLRATEQLPVLDALVTVQVSVTWTLARVGGGTVGAIREPVGDVLKLLARPLPDRVVDLFGPASSHADDAELSVEVAIKVGARTLRARVLPLRFKLIQIVVPTIVAFFRQFDYAAKGLYNDALEDGALALIVPNGPAPGSDNRLPATFAVPGTDNFLVSVLLNALGLSGLPLGPLPVSGPSGLSPSGLGALNPASLLPDDVALPLVRALGDLARALTQFVLSFAELLTLNVPADGPGTFIYYGTQLERNALDVYWIRHGGLAAQHVQDQIRSAIIIGKPGVPTAAYTGESMSTPGTTRGDELATFWSTAPLHVEVFPAPNLSSSRGRAVISVERGFAAMVPRFDLIDVVGDYWPSSDAVDAGRVWVTTRLLDDGPYRSRQDGNDNLAASISSYRIVR